MPQPYTRVEIKLQDSIRQRVDICRQSTPMATWIREAIMMRLEIESKSSENERDPS